MQIEYQKNGVKIIGALPCAIRRSDSTEGFDMRYYRKEVFVDRILVTLFLYYIGIQVSTLHFISSVSSRGHISGFSRKSSHRFRDILLSSYVPGKNFLAITVTLPSCQFFTFREAVLLSFATMLPLSIFTFDYFCPGDWERLIKRFRQNLIRKNLAGIWRVELQKRNVPHLHIIGFGNDINDVSEYAYSWFSAVDFLKDFNGCPLTAYEGFFVYGFVCKFVRSENWVKYVASHASKHKESQLGWNGRQWGIFNKHLIKDFDGCRHDLSADTQVMVLRTLRRMTHYKGYSSKLVGSLQLFVSPAIIKRLVDFYSVKLPF